MAAGWVVIVCVSLLGRYGGPPDLRATMQRGGANDVKSVLRDVSLEIQLVTVMPRQGLLCGTETTAVYEHWDDLMEIGRGSDIPNRAQRWS